MNNTARVIQLRPPKLQPPPDPNEVYLAACAEFLRTCFEGFPRFHIKLAAEEMRRTRALFFAREKSL